MKITNNYGLYIATFKHRDGSVCMGYGASWAEAAVYCHELIEARDVR